MPLESKARARFAALIARDPVPLDESVLSIAEEEYPGLEPEEYLVRLDALAARVQRRVAVAGRSAATLRALRAVLFEEEGLTGNEADYGDPRNSFLNDVLDRRVGIPISLSVVYMEVARRIGLSLLGVGFPGHFLSKHTAPNGTEIFVDAFHGGEMLSADECVARYRARSGGRDLDRRHLDAIAPRQILARMLHNLKRTYLERHDHVRAYWVLDRILLLAPGQLEALRDRGIVSARLGVAAAAERDLESYLAGAPAATDVAEVRRVLAALRARRPLVN
jgi:regulator of sirC expression with transglutaminase-like and TPR domain